MRGVRYVAESTPGNSDAMLRNFFDIRLEDAKPDTVYLRADRLHKRA
jgi:hypothetical protein